jgi:hypothetical protein
MPKILAVLTTVFLISVASALQIYRLVCCEDSTIQTPKVRRFDAFGPSLF